MLDVYIIHAGDDSGGRNGVMQEITEVRQSIWKAHWKNAREVGFKDILKKLLDNHISLYSDANYYPEERVERRKIIQYLQDKIETLYGQA